MRGNEKLNAGLTRWIPGFPIPMRGNELNGQRRDVRVAQFPIPMRGNETDGPRKGRWNPAVPDPHEG